MIATIIAFILGYMIKSLIEDDTNRELKNKYNDSINMYKEYKNKYKNKLINLYQVELDKFKTENDEYKLIDPCEYNYEFKINHYYTTDHSAYYAESFYIKNIEQLEIQIKKLNK